MDTESQKTYNIKQLSQELGAPSYMLRRFCLRGYVPGIRRTRTNRLVFTPAQATWLSTLVRLQSSGFSNADLRNYVWLCRKGNSTIAERKAILETKKRQLWQTISEAQANIDFIERKTEIFDKALSGEEPLPEEWF